jgi:hypothetical protein
MGVLRRVVAHSIGSASEQGIHQLAQGEEVGQLSGQEGRLARIIGWLEAGPGLWPHCSGAVRELDHHLGLSGTDCPTQHRHRLALQRMVGPGKGNFVWIVLEVGSVECVPSTGSTMEC